MQNSRILFIIPYFGKFGALFPLFLNSCKDNPTINWLIITDDRTAYNYPLNVKVVYMTFDELRSQFQQIFDFPILLNSPYKLCDFKPTYGKVFEDYLAEYDFWGHCDTDLIFGNIREFLTEDILSNSDKIFSRGHLSIYRNSPYMNDFYRTNTDGYYKIAYSCCRNIAFDEWGGKFGISNFFKKYLPESRFYDEILFDDLSTTESNFIPSQKRNQSYKNIIYSYNSNGITKYAIIPNVKGCGDVMHMEPVLYVHFQKRQMKIEIDSMSNYLIVPNRIIPFAPLSEQRVKHLGKKELINTQYIKIKIGNLKRILKGFSKDK